VIGPLPCNSLSIRITKQALQHMQRTKENLRLNQAGLKENVVILSVQIKRTYVSLLFNDSSFSPFKITRNVLDVKVKWKELYGCATERINLHLFMSVKVWERGNYSFLSSQSQKYR
jgi:hypothetical protein